MRSEPRAWIRGAALALLALAPAGPGRAGEPPRLVERVLAAVDGAPVLLSEVRLLAALQGLTEERALEAAIDERLMFAQATRLTRAALTAEQEEGALQSLRERPGAQGWPEASLRRLARRQATILKYVEFRFRSQVRVEDAAVRQLYDAEWAGRPAAPPFESVQDELRERLARQALDQRVESWVRELRSGAEIRRNP